MLQAIRDGVKGWIAWVVIGLIALPFIFMGGYDHFTGGSDRDAVIAKVAGEEIVRHELNRAVDQRRMQLRELFGGQLPPGMFDEESLRREALQELIDERLLKAYVERQNLRVSDEEVAQAIRNQQVFHEGGRFSRERYRALLQQNRLTPEQYEQLVREDLLIATLEEALRVGGAVVPRQLDQLVSIQEERRRFEYVELEAAAFLDEIEVTDSEVERRYAERSFDYMAPEAVRLAYLEVHEDELADAGLIDEMANVAFERPESLEPAAEVVGRKIAHSGWLTRDGGDDDGLAQYPEIVAAAFSEDVREHGYNSDLIEVSGGRFFVVRLEAYRPPAPRPLVEVADEIRADLRRERALDEARAQAERWSAELTEGADATLEEKAAAHGIELFAAGPVRRDDRGHPQAVVRKAFALADGAVGSVQVAADTIALVSVQEIEPGRPDDLAEEEREQLRQQLGQLVAHTDFRAFLEALREEADVQINEGRL
ncbi:hypothetical protein CKO15_04455 [Halorhodospira abdelmalekii]|uniref:peptidylprolyl isomerase n=1 Tax=Halorhodospira abdelmalekii TaxID=421629 RepID=UPI001906465B|nr:peptidylprolyl isomerase [Halorhodospira abdelmalekii]MBK1734549.1 hypothetical protein [Halorhodospira abdelmalekii]